MPNVFKGTANQIESNLNKVQEIHDYDDKIESYPSVACMTQYVDSKTNRIAPKAVVAFLGGPFEYDDPDDLSLGGTGYGACTVIHDENTCVVVGIPYETVSNPVLLKYLENNNISKIDMLCIPNYLVQNWHTSVYKRLKNKGYIDKDTYVVAPHFYTTLTGTDWVGSSDYSSYLKSDSENGKIILKTPNENDSSPSEYVCGTIKVKCYNVNNIHLQSYINPDSTSVHYGNCSMVNLIEVAGCKILTTGDIQELAIRRMWENNGVLSHKDIDIMTVPYCGADVGPLPNHILNNIWAKHGVIQYASDDDLLLKRATPFTKTLLNNGCKVNTTYGKDNVIRNVIYHLNDGNITPVQTGLAAGNMIPYILSDTEILSDSDVWVASIGHSDITIPRYDSEEYLTNEMFNGMPVFTKLLKYTLKDGIFSDWLIADFAHGIPNFHSVVERHAYIEHSNENMSAIPMFGDPAEGDMVLRDVYADTMKFSFNEAECDPGTSIYIKLKYTKKD